MAEWVGARPVHRRPHRRAGPRPVRRPDPVAHAGPRRQPRDPAPQRGGRTPDDHGPLPGRPRPHRLRTGHRRLSRWRARMDLVAGDAREILTALAADDREALADRTRFTAFLSMGGGLDPTWLDLFAEACRDVTGSRRSGRLHRCPARARRTRGHRRADDRAGGRGLGRARRPDRGPATSTGRRALDRPARRGVRLAVPRGQALDPPARRAISSPSPGPPIAPPTSCSPGRCERTGPPRLGGVGVRRAGRWILSVDRLDRQRRRALGRGRAERGRQDDAPRDRARLPVADRGHGRGPRRADRAGRHPGAPATGRLRERGARGPDRRRPAGASTSS